MEHNPHRLEGFVKEPAFRQRLGEFLHVIEVIKWNHFDGGEA